VQILTGFLLTIPFTTRFPDLDDMQRVLYLATLCAAVVATGLIIAPVAFHRTLFRQGEKPWLVHAANWCARAGLVALAIAMVGVIWLVFDVVLSRSAGYVAAGVSVVYFAGLWGVLPITKRVD
jgi:hypothetical protein